MKYHDPKHWHEAANLFPLLPDNELAELAADIRTNGLLNPVVLLDEKVLDGRNRLLACKQASVEPTFVNWKQNGVSPVVWVIAQNLRRRHLEAGQRAAVAVEAKPMLAVEAKKNQSAAGNPLGKSKQSAFPIFGKSSPVHAEKDVAKQFDVSHGYVYAAQKIKDKDEKVFQELKAGTLSIPEAEKKLGFKQSTAAMVSSDSNEWYTPEEFVNAARKVLGAFDLDPASCTAANKWIKATKFYSKENDGLTKKWKGRVWLNPPYGDAGPQFVSKLIKGYKAGDITETVLVVNAHCTDAKWFQPLFDRVLCFTNHRPRFLSEGGGIGAAPTHGAVFVYFGNKPDAFHEHFARFGAVVKKLTK